MRMVRGRDVERRLSELEREDIDHSEEYGRNPYYRRCPCRNYAVCLKRARHAIQTDSRDYNHRLHRHERNQFSFGADVRIRRARGVGAEYEEYVRKRQCKDDEQEIAVCEEQNAGDDYEDEVCENPEVLRGSDNHILLLEELLDVVEGLKHGRTHASLHPCGYLPVKSRYDSADDGRKHNEENCADYLQDCRRAYCPGFSADHITAPVMKV